MSQTSKDFPAFPAYGLALFNFVGFMLHGSYQFFLTKYEGPYSAFSELQNLLLAFTFLLFAIFFFVYKNKRVLNALSLMQILTWVYFIVTLVIYFDATHTTISMFNFLLEGLVPQSLVLILASLGALAFSVMLFLKTRES